MRLDSPMRRWEVLAAIAQGIDAKTFVEVGCKEGRTTGYLLANLPGLQVTAIDPWCPVPNSAEDYKDWDFEKIQSEFWRNVGEHKDRLQMMQTVSSAAVESFADKSVDVVFIDAAHDYKGCSEDIRLWLPKVREGGYLCGHDFNHKWPGVHRAVASAFPLLQVTVMPDSVWCVQVTPELLYGWNTASEWRAA